MPGLLGNHPYAGLLGDDTLGYAQSMGLLGAGIGLLGASGPSPVPINMGQALGQGLQQGLGAYEGALGQGIQAMQVKADLEGREATRLAQETLLGDPRFANSPAASALVMAGQYGPAVSLAGDAPESGTLNVGGGPAQTAPNQGGLIPPAPAVTDPNMPHSPAAPNPNDPTGIAEWVTGPGRYRGRAGRTERRFAGSRCITGGASTTGPTGGTAAVDQPVQPADLRQSEDRV